MGSKNNILDEQFDSGTPVPTNKFVLDRNDFSSEDEMDRYFKEHKEAPREAYDYYIKSTSQQEIDKFQKVTFTRATGKEIFTLNNLPSNNVVQSCYIGTFYLYATQQINNPAGAYQLISRFPLNGSNNIYRKDYMRLNRSGHSQILQWFTNSSGISYFWIVTKATLVDNSTTAKYDWGTQVGRLQYQAGTTIDYTDIARISSINRANKIGQSFGTLKRCEAALDSSRKYLLIWSMSTSDKAQFAYYKTNEINAILDRKESSTSKYISAGDASITHACITSYEVPTFYTKVMYQSIQGIEFNDTQHIYISSGPSNKQPVIQKGIWGTHKFINNAVYISDGVMSNPAKYETETEGIQLKGDSVYLNISTHNPTSKYIYSIPKNNV
ncbi:MAG: helveticin J family class III bacteriocin [Levilactobacillus brevis]